MDKKHTPEDGEFETAVQDAADELDKNHVVENGKLDMAVRDTFDRLHQDHTAEKHCSTSYRAVSEWQTQ